MSKTKEFLLAWVVVTIFLFVGMGSFVGIVLLGVYISPWFFLLLAPYIGALMAVNLVIQ